MKLISHRGNIDGIDSKNENSLNYVTYAIDSGYDCEVDVWVINGRFYFGHDDAEHHIPISYIYSHQNSLWLHCKNINALQYFNSFNNNVGQVYNYFWHQEDDYTLTGKGYIWAYPGKLIDPALKTKSICVLPEKSNTTITGFHGICSDVIKKYKRYR